MNIQFFTKEMQNHADKLDNNVKEEIITNASNIAFGDYLDFEAQGNQPETAKLIAISTGLSYMLTYITK